MQVIIDSREKKLSELFAKNKTPFVNETIPLGDIVITKEETEDIKEDDKELTPEEKLLGMKKKVKKIVIERKTFTDLKASITDGRYKEQKSRLKTLPHGTCYYILENNDNEYKTLSKKLLYGMYVNTIIRDGISVLIANSLEETYELIVKIKDTFEQYDMEWKMSDDNKDQNKDVKVDIKKKKPEGENVYKLQLCCFPNISTKKAELIMEKYPTISVLIDAIKTDKFEIKGIGAKIKDIIKNGLQL